MYRSLCRSCVFVCIHFCVCVCVYVHVYIHSVHQWSGIPGFNPRLSHTKDFKNGT